MRAIIADDEPAFRLTLRELLALDHPKIEIVEECSDGASAVIAIRKHQPDLVFLDVEMPELKGTEVLKQFPNANFETIFTTSHSDYALEALRLEARDYLLKPVQRLALSEALEKINKKKSEPAPVRKLAIHSTEGMQLISLDQIIRAEADNNYTTFHLTNGRKIVCSKPLGEFENSLLPHGFFRTHKSHLISLAQLSKILKSEGGFIEMQNGEQVPLSRHRKDELLRMIQQFSV